MASAVGSVIACHRSQDLDEYKDSNKLVVVDFSASWCGPCRSIAPFLADWAKRLQDVIFLKVDVDEVKDLARQWQVEAMPTFVLLRDGKQVDRLVGAKKEELLGKIVKHRPIKY
uniref:Thioredoxin n=1 Tax=Anthurium amnicola TaxID=1678845 RepID=A0A1D1ZHV9_9ARAE